MYLFGLAAIVEGFRVGRILPEFVPIPKVGLVIRALFCCSSYTYVCACDASCMRRRLNPKPNSGRVICEPNLFLVQELANLVAPRLPTRLKLRA